MWYCKKFWVDKGPTISGSEIKWEGLFCFNELYLGDVLLPYVINH